MCPILLLALRPPIWYRHVWALHVAKFSEFVYPPDLLYLGLDSLSFSITTGSYALHAFSATGSPEPWGKDSMETALLEISVPRYLSLCIMSGCESLYLFPYSMRGLTYDGWARHRSEYSRESVYCYVPLARIYLVYPLVPGLSSLKYLATSGALGMGSLPWFQP